MVLRVFHSTFQATHLNNNWLNGDTCMYNQSYIYYIFKKVIKIMDCLEKDTLKIIKKEREIK